MIMDKLLIMVLITSFLVSCNSSDAEDAFEEFPWAAALLASYTINSDESRWRFYSGIYKDSNYYFFSFCSVNCSMLPPKIFNRTGEEVDISYFDLENLVLVWQPKKPEC